ncbi:OB-fold-containig protein [Teredinibacter franksiae]|uniref:OB-fold-containig protein n=1 Tax=Teredinibacter franksiae TaxID=2761453 RepID=UPI0016234AA1|nr:OB-fold-containig protein [Teredinibacter franksiae]
MFAIFLTEAMDPFYEICSSFPTIIFTILLIFCVFYWVLAVLGLVDIEILDFDVPDSLDTSGLTDDLSNLNVMSGLLLRLGLNGVPFTIVITALALIGWMLSFTVVYFTNPFIPGTLLEFLVGIPIFIGTLYVSAMVTAAIIKPLRPIFQSANQEVQKTILGQVAVVRTGRVDKNFGEAKVEDGGAGLIVKVRSYKDEEFQRGDKVVLLEHVTAENVYKVISENDFTG